MAGGIIVSGATHYKPGVYADPIDYSALAGKGLSAGNLCAVGAFPSLPRGVPVLFTSPHALESFDPSDVTLRRISMIAFNAANADGRVGAISAITLVNVQNNTAASYTFLDEAGKNSVKFLSNRYGTKGNAVSVKLVGDAIDGKKLNVYISGGGSAESFLSVGMGNLVSFSCPVTAASELGPVGDACTVSIDNDGVNVIDGWCNRFKWSWVRTMWKGTAINPGALQDNEVYTFVGQKLVVSGKLTMKAVGASGGGGKGLVMTVNGLDSTGAHVTGTATLSDPFLDGDTATFKDGNGADILFSRLDDMKWHAVGGYAGTAKLLGNAFDLSLTPENGFTYVSDLLALINGYNGKGWSATALQPQVGAVPANQLDKQLTVDALAAPAVFRADLYVFVKTINDKSGLVTVARVPGNTLDGVVMPNPWSHANTVIQGPLSGGTQATVVEVTDFPVGLQAIESQDIQAVAVLSTNIDAASAAVAHCKRMAVKCKRRHAWVGCAANQTIANVYANAITLLNSEFISVCAQQILEPNPMTGVLEYLDPQYQALQAAAMFCGRNVGVSLTNKSVNVRGLKQNWTLGLDADEDLVCKYGIYAYTLDQTGYKVLENITTWVGDDDAAQTQVSAHESLEASIEDLNNWLMVQIGNPAIISDGKLKSMVEGRLAQQVSGVAGAVPLITAWKNVVITTIQNKKRIDYAAAPLFSMDFVVIGLHAFDNAGA